MSGPATTTTACIQHDLHGDYHGEPPQPPCHDSSHWEWNESRRRRRSADRRIGPAASFYSPDFNNFILKYEDVRQAASPRDALLEFLQSTYDAGATPANWNRAELERAGAHA